MTLIDPTWGVAVVPFAVAAVLSPFVAYVLAHIRRRFF